MKSEIKICVGKSGVLFESPGEVLVAGKDHERCCEDIRRRWV